MGNGCRCQDSTAQLEASPSFAQFKEQPARVLKHDARRGTSHSSAYKWGHGTPS